MKKILLIALITITAIACNKNQRAVKKLDGEWKVTKITYTEDNVSESETDIDMTLSFDNCKLKNNEYCSMTTTLTSDSDTYTESGFYKVTSDGTILILADDLNGSDSEAITIVELSSKKLILEQVDGNEKIQIELEK